MARVVLLAFALLAAVVATDALADSLRVNKPLVPYKLEPLRWGTVRPRGCGDDLIDPLKLLSCLHCALQAGCLNPA